MRLLGLVMGTIAVVGVGCGSDGHPGTGSGTVSLSVTGFTPLKSPSHYSAWAIGDATTLIGSFNVDMMGALVTQTGTPIDNGTFGTMVKNASALLITVESGGATAPGKSHFLAGPIVSQAATLTVGDKGALGDPFTGASGKYTLETPTDNAGFHQLSGVWFLDVGTGMGSPTAGLMLPALPAGWLYEGWAVVNKIPLSTGKFTSASGPDMSHKYSGTGTAPPFPGEDFLQNAPAGTLFPIDIAGGQVAISIEPDPDDSAAPFGAQPLSAMVPPAAADHKTYTMDNQAMALPTATATLK